MADEERPLSSYPVEVQFYLRQGFILEVIPTFISPLDERYNRERWHSIHMHPGRRTWSEEVKSFGRPPTHTRWINIIGESNLPHSIEINDLGEAFAKSSPEVKADLERLLKVGLVPPTEPNARSEVARATWRRRKARDEEE